MSILPQILAQQPGGLPNNEIVVPDELVTRSRPTGHSVPIIRKRRHRSRPHPCRNLAIACLVALTSMFGLVLVVKSSVAAGQAAGYHLVCPIVETPKGPVSGCHWEK